MSIRVANAPCSWGILEFEGRAPVYQCSEVLDEMGAAGYAGTELGDWGFMPTDPRRLKHELQRRSLELVGAFVPVALSRTDDHERGVQMAVRTASLLSDAGFAEAFVVLADQTAGNLPRIRNAGRITAADGLTPRQWDVLAGGATAVARAVRERTSLRTVFHPHCGSFVETGDEIDALMQRTDPELLGLCLDTGHITYAAGDPLTVYERYAGRVRHVHVKDCDARIAGEARDHRLDYLTAVRRGVFCELGRGSVDFPRLIDAFRRHHYHGWAVVEQDVLPALGTPASSAARNRAFLRTLGL